MSKRQRELLAAEAKELLELYQTDEYRDPPITVSAPVLWDLMDELIQEENEVLRKLDD